MCRMKSVTSHVSWGMKSHGASASSWSALRPNNAHCTCEQWAEFEGSVLESDSTSVFEVPVADHWLAKIEALALPSAMFMALALSHHVIGGCSVMIG